MRLNVISEKFHPAQIGLTRSVFDFSATVLSCQKHAKCSLLTQPDTLCETYRTIKMEYGAQAAKHNVNAKTVNAKTLPTG